MSGPKTIPFGWKSYPDRKILAMIQRSLLFEDTHLLETLVIQMMTMMHLEVDPLEDHLEEDHPEADHQAEDHLGALIEI
jgi:hypothetical protein